MDHLSQLQARIDIVRRDADAVEALVALIDAHGISNTEQLFDAVDRGALELTDVMVEHLERAGVVAPVPEPIAGDDRYR